MVQLSAAERRVVPAMLHGVATQLVSGLGLVGADEALGRNVDHPKAGLKLVVALAVLGLLLAYRARPVLASGVFFAVGGLTLLNVGVAVFW